MRRSTTSRRRAAEQSAKIGSEVKLARVTLAMTGRQVADRAGVSSSTEARVELGDPNLTVGTMCAVAEAVGLDIVIRAYVGRAPSLRDTGQLTAANQIQAWAHSSWHPDVELLMPAW